MIFFNVSIPAKGGKEPTLPGIFQEASRPAKPENQGYSANKGKIKAKRKEAVKCAVSNCIHANLNSQFDPDNINNCALKGAVLRVSKTQGDSSAAPLGART